MATFKDGLTVDETTGKVLAVGDKTAQYNTTTNTSSVTPNLSLADATTQANTAFTNGLVSPMSLADIRAKEAAKTASSTSSVEAQFNPQIQQAEVSGAQTVGAAEGTLAGGGVGAGSGIGSAQVAFLAATKTDVENRIKNIEDQKAAAISAGNLAASDWADTQLTKLNEYNNNLTLAKANYALQLMSQNVSQQNLELQQKEQAQKEIDTANTLKIQQQAADTDTINTLSKISNGKEITINGITYKGLSDASLIDPSQVEISYDDKGFATGKDKITGTTLWKSTTPTGKTKTQASNVTVNMKESAAGARNPLVLGGKQIGWQSYNEQTGKPQNFNMDGSVMQTLPSGIQISTFGASNTAPKVDAFGYPIEE